MSLVVAEKSVFQRISSVDATVPSPREPLDSSGASAVPATRGLSINLVSFSAFLIFPLGKCFSSRLLLFKCVGGRPRVFAAARRLAPGALRPCLRSVLLLWLLLDRWEPQSFVASVGLSSKASSLAGVASLMYVKTNNVC